MPDERCETCRYWLLWRNSKTTFRDNAGRDPMPLGACRRYPPAVVSRIDYEDGTWGANASPPEVQGDDWCGEYRQADNHT